MKKALILVLALVMVCMSTFACAESLQITPGAPSNCDIDSFKMYFSMMAGASGYNFVWQDNVTSENGYDVYKADSEDGMMTLSIYVQGGKVVYGEAIGSITANAGNTTSASKFGEWFGASIAGMVLGMYIGENGMNAVTDSVGTQFQNDLMPLVKVLQDGLTTPTALMNGLASVSTVAGYPTGLEVSGSVSGTSITLNMRIIVASPGCTVTK